MSFLETPRFPEAISLGGSGGPEYQTDVIIVNSGHESRNANWSAARARYDVGHSGRTQAQTDELIAFFRSVKGRAHGFRFKDWADFQCDAADSVCTLVSGSIYQLGKRYASGAMNETRTISKPVAGTVTVYRARSSVTSDITGSTTIDTATGRITVTGHVSGDVYTWSGEFDVPCRFDTDQMQIELVNKSAIGGFIYSWGSIPIIEIRV